MNANPSLNLTTSGEIAVLTLERPDRRNAISQSMWRAVPEMVARAEVDPEVKLLVVRGAGGHFAGGADIAEFGTALASRALAEAYFEDVGRAGRALSGCAKPTLAAIEGACVGGGLALALCCDLRLAAADARLGVTPAKLGLSYSLEDTRRLVQTVGASAAKDMLFTGRLLAAEEAKAIGLVNAVAKPDAFETALSDQIQAICAASQWSVRTAKTAIGLVLEGAQAETELTRRHLIEAVDGEDFHEGRAAFLGKRRPRFTYR